MGGHAFDGISPVPRANFENIWCLLRERLLDMGAHDVVPVGSAGKVDMSNDVDLAVEFPKGRDALIEMFLSSTSPRISKDQVRKFGSNTISLKLPFDFGRQFCQVDIMIGKISYLKWARFGDPTRSNFKGVARNLLLNSWNRHNGIRLSEHVRVRKALDWERGLMSLKQTNIGKSGQELKEWKTLESTLLADDPQEITCAMFGPKHQIVWTFEDVVNILLLRETGDFFPKFYNELQALLEQTPHMLGPDPHKAIEQIKQFVG